MAAIVTVFPAMVLLVGLVIDGWFRLRGFVAQGASLTIRQILNELSEGWGYGVLLAALGIASWFSYKQYTRWAGLEAGEAE